MERQRTTFKLRLLLCSYCGNYANLSAVSVCYKLRQGSQAHLSGSVLQGRHRMSTRLHRAGVVCEVTLLILKIQECRHS